MFITRQQLSYDVTNEGRPGVQAVISEKGNHYTSFQCIHRSFTRHNLLSHSHRDDCSLLRKSSYPLLYLLSLLLICALLVAPVLLPVCLAFAQ
jgi:hypothetical protein